MRSGLKPNSRSDAETPMKAGVSQEASTYMLGNTAEPRARIDCSHNSIAAKPVENHITIQSVRDEAQCAKRC